MREHQGTTQKKVPENTQRSNKKQQQGIIRECMEKRGKQMEDEVDAKCSAKDKAVVAGVISEEVGEGSVWDRECSGLAMGAQAAL